MTTLTEMREAAQGANELEQIWVPESCIFISADDCLHDTYEPAVLVSNNLKINKLADAVTQLCDEVEKLREALAYIGYSPTRDRKEYSARAELQESNERFGE